MGRLIAASMLVVLSTLDMLTTRIGLSVGGTEINPFVAPWVHTDWFVYVKTMAVAGVVLLIVAYVKAQWIWRFLYAVVAVYAVVVSSNTLQILMFT